MNCMFINTLLLFKMVLTSTFNRKKTRNSLFRDALIADQSKQIDEIKFQKFEIKRNINVKNKNQNQSKFLIN